MQLTLTLKMNTAQVVETSVTVNNTSPIQDCVHPDDHTQPTYEMSPGFNSFTEELYVSKKGQRKCSCIRGQITPTRDNNRKKIVMCVTTSQPEKSGKNHICSEHNLPTRRKKSLEQAAYHLVQGNSGVLPTDPLFSHKKGRIYKGKALYREKTVYPETHKTAIYGPWTTQEGRNTHLSKVSCFLLKSFHFRRLQKR